MGDKGSQGNAGAVGIRGPTGVSGKRVSTLSQVHLSSLLRTCRFDNEDKNEDEVGENALLLYPFALSQNTN